MVTGWVEVYKKSMTTLVLLQIIDELSAVPAATIRTEFTDRTSWQITERGLYRTLKRLAGSGLLSVEAVPVERTGRPRKDYSLTDLGLDFLARLQSTTAAVDPSKG
nr:PadR family transcriptional regulator [Janibacter cremeus]